MPAKMVPEWEIPARDLYMEYPQRRRDEAVRTATFGAAAMIYAARSLGLGSTPMIGFDDEAVRREFGLAEDEVPVMLLSVGPERLGNWPQKPRLPVADVLELRSEEHTSELQSLMRISYAVFCLQKKKSNKI